MSVNWTELAESTRVQPAQDVDLVRGFDPGRVDHHLTKESGEQALAEAVAELEGLQDRLYAQADRAVLVVLQAIDAAGKDGTIKHVMSGVNPEGVDVYGFKSPSPVERAHGYLWRHQAGLPELGRISIFNRSHYENVLVTRVHPELLWPDTPIEQRDGLWKRRYREINDWERYLTDNGTVVVKLFLNVSKDEQARRFLSRIEDPAKNWKFSSADLKERGFWDAYRSAFEHMLEHTSTDRAPWHVVPADHKWFSHLCTSAILLRTLWDIDPHYPKVGDDMQAELQAAKVQLQQELGS